MIYAIAYILLWLVLATLFGLWLGFLWWQPERTVERRKPVYGPRPPWAKGVQRKTQALAP